MARFGDFDLHEQQVIKEALEWATSEFYDPGHTKEDRDTLRALIEEIKRMTQETGNFVKRWKKTPDVNIGIGKVVAEAEPDNRLEAPGHITTEKPTRKVTEKPKLQPGEYAGFLYIECAHCGHVHAFCAKQPIRSYHCEECGQRTPLIDMYPLRVTCECGAHFNYKTNIGTQQMDVTCYKCGAPVAVEWSEKEQRYQPFTYRNRKHGNGGRKGGKK